TVEVIFRPHRGLRTLDVKLYCGGEPGQRLHIVAQQILDPGERRTLAIRLERGPYRIIASHAGRAAELTASVVGSSPSASLCLTPEAVEAHPPVVRAGEITFDLENQTSCREVFRIEHTGPLITGVTAAMAMSHPSFQSLFFEQLIARGDHVSVSRMAFLFVEVEDRVSLFDEQGDVGALGVLTQLEEQVREQAMAQQGSLVEKDAAFGVLVAAFVEGASALKAALGVLDRTKGTSSLERVRVSVHEGRCMALTGDARIRYFGETLERGASLLAVGEPGCAVVSAPVADDHDVARLILEADVEREVRVAKTGAYKGRRFTLIRPRAT
ncbi:MAG: hypothetical protein ABI134_27950, partial [Byssovorax sp.]